MWFKNWSSPQPPYLLRSQDAVQRALEKALSLETNSVPWPPVSGMGYDWVRTLPMWGKKSVRISTWPCVVLGILKHGWKWEYDSGEVSEFKIMGIVCISGSCLSCFIAINLSWNPYLDGKHHGQLYPYHGPIINNFNPGGQELWFQYFCGGQTPHWRWYKLCFFNLNRRCSPKKTVHVLDQSVDSGWYVDQYPSCWWFPPIFPIDI